MQKQNKKRILITGGVSLLGKYLLRELYRDFDIFLTTHKKKSPLIWSHLSKINRIDITDFTAIKSYIAEIKPDVIIHLAAISNIDYCEAHPKEAREINITGTRNIYELAKNTETHLIFISSNAVFDGNHPPYTEVAKTNPINWYGRLKVESENIFLAHPLTTIIRCPTLFGWPPEGARNNDVPYYLQKLREKKAIYLVNDRFFNPLSAATAALAIKKIVKKKTFGIMHIAGPEKTNRYEFVKLLSTVYHIKNPPELVPVSNDYFATIAQRPKDATLTTAKMQKKLEIQPKSLRREIELIKKENHSDTL